MSASSSGRVAPGVSSITLYADGASRGNPGPAAIGAVLADDKGVVLARVSRRVGCTTNNQAEYLALIAGLEEARRLGASQVRVQMDSELVVRQMQGRYRVRAAALRPLHTQASDLAASFPHFSIEHVERGRNAEADALANQALDGSAR